MNKKNLKSQISNLKFSQGFSLVEVVLVIMAVGFLALLISNLPSSLASIGRSRHSSIAKDIASKQVESLRRQTYDNLPLGSNTIIDSDLSNLPESSGVYEVSDCPTEICARSEEIKQIKVTVSWKEAGQEKKVELITMTARGGVGQ